MVERAEQYLLVARIYTDSNGGGGISPPWGLPSSALLGASQPGGAAPDGWGRSQWRSGLLSDLCRIAKQSPAFQAERSRGLSEMGAWLEKLKAEGLVQDHPLHLGGSMLGFENSADDPEPMAIEKEEDEEEEGEEAAATVKPGLEVSRKGAESVANDDPGTALDLGTEQISKVQQEQEESWEWRQFCRRKHAELAVDSPDEADDDGDDNEKDFHNDLHDDSEELAWDDQQLSNHRIRMEANGVQIPAPQEDCRLVERTDQYLFCARLYTDNNGGGRILPPWAPTAIGETVILLTSPLHPY